MLTSPIINLSKDLIISSTVLVLGKSNRSYFLSASSRVSFPVGPLVCCSTILRCLLTVHSYSIVF